MATKPKNRTEGQVQMTPEQYEQWMRMQAAQAATLPTPAGQPEIIVQPSPEIMSEMARLMPAGVPVGPAIQQPPQAAATTVLPTPAQVAVSNVLAPPPVQPPAAPALPAAAPQVNQMTFAQYQQMMSQAAQTPVQTQQIPAQAQIPQQAPVNFLPPAAQQMMPPGATPNVSNPFAPPPPEDMFDVDLTNVSDSGWVILDKGNYEVICSNLEKGTSNAGNLQYIWEFTVINSPKYKDATVKYFTAIVPAALWKVSEVLIALGLGKNGQQVKFSKRDAIGKRCLIDAGPDTYNNVTRTSIFGVLPHPAGWDPRNNAPIVALPGALPGTNTQGVPF